LGHVVCKGQNRYTYEISVGRSEGKRPLERLRRRWKYTRTDLKEAGWERAEFIRKFRERILRWAFANPQKERMSSIAGKILAYEGLCSEDLVISFSLLGHRLVEICHSHRKNFGTVIQVVKRQTDWLVMFISN